MAVTLMEAVGIDMSGPFEKVTETYSVEVAFIGSHLHEDSFSEVQMEFDWLSDWLGPPSLIGDDPQNIDLSIVKRMPLTLQEIIVRRGRIRLSCGVEGREDEGAVHLDRVAFVSANPTQAADWKTLLQDWVRPVQDFLTISLGRVVQVTRLQFRPVATERFGDRQVEARFHVIQPTPIETGDERGRDSSAAIHSFSASTLYTGRDTSYCVNCVIRSWMMSWQENSGLIALLLAHFMRRSCIRHRGTDRYFKLSKDYMHASLLGQNWNVRRISDGLMGLSRRREKLIFHSITLNGQSESCRVETIRT